MKLKSSKTKRKSKRKSIRKSKRKSIRRKLVSNREIKSKLSFRDKIKDGMDNSKATIWSTALMKATENNDEEAVNLLLATGAEVNTQVNGVTALIIAVNNTNEKIVELLLQNGADVNKQNNDGKTALMISIVRCNEKIFVMLLNAGADIEITNKEGKKALDIIDIIVSSEKKSIIGLIPTSQILKKILIKYKTYEPKDTIFDRIKKNKNNTDDVIYKKDELNSQENLHKITPLMFAANNLYSDLFIKLLNLGADASLVDVRGNTALIHAVSHKKDDGNNSKIIKILCERTNKDLINKQNDNGNTALIFAVKSKKHNYVKLLLKHGADPDISDNKGNTACNYANDDVKLISLILTYKNRFPSFIKALEINYSMSNNLVNNIIQECSKIDKYYDYFFVAQGDDKKIENYFKNHENKKNSINNLFKLFVYHDCKDILNLLYIKKSDFLKNLINEVDSSSVLFIFENKKIGFSRFLEFFKDIDESKFLDKINKIINKFTPVELDFINNFLKETKKGRLKNIESLVKDIQTNNVASELNNPLVIEELSVSSSLDLIDSKTGLTPLLAACSYSNSANDRSSIVKLLLSKGANPNVMNEDSTMSPLIAACGKRLLDIVELLLKYNADTNLKTSNGLNAFYYLLNNNRTYYTNSEEMEKINKIYDLLVSHGANINEKFNGENSPLFHFLKLSAPAEPVDTLDPFDPVCPIELSAERRSAREEAEIAAREASRESALYIVEYLLSKGHIDPNIIEEIDGKNITPLIYAIKLSLDSKIIKMLIIGGADPNKFL